MIQFEWNEQLCWRIQNRKFNILLEKKVLMQHDNSTDYQFTDPTSQFAPIDPISGEARPGGFQGFPLL